MNGWGSLDLDTQIRAEENGDRYANVKLLSSEISTQKYLLEQAGRQARTWFEKH